jgi:hypothetical protein
MSAVFHPHARRSTKENIAPAFQMCSTKAASFPSNTSESPPPLSQHTHSLVVYQDVCALDVTMHNTLLVDVLEAL